MSLLRILLLSLSFFLLTGISYGEDLSSVRTTMSRYLDAQIRWQDNLARLIIEQKPEFEQIAVAQREHQHALIALKRARFEYLAENDLGRLEIGELGRFSNFTWSEADTETASMAPGYASLEERVRKTRALNDAQSDWDAFRDFFRTEFSLSEDYKRELAVFLAELESIKEQAGMK